VGGVGRQALQRAHDHRLDPGVVDCPRRAGPGLVMQPVNAVLNKAPTPLAYRLPVQAQLGSHDLVLPAFRARQDDPRS
jgi:hypothetical protein